MADEISKDKSSWGGARAGAGRPKGSENPATKDRRIAEENYKSRVAKNVDRIFNSQLDLAVGEKYLMVKRVEGEGKNRKTWVEVVTDIEAIKRFIDDDGVSLNEAAGEDFYYMTTKPANNQALDSLMNRAFGKPKESVQLSEDPDNPINAYKSMSEKDLNERIKRIIGQ